MQLSLSNIKRTYKCSRILKKDLLLTFKKKVELKEIDTGILFLKSFFPNINREIEGTDV